MENTKDKSQASQPWLHVTVAAIIEHEQRFLLVEEHTSQGIVFNQPAGHLENHETLHDAVCRETYEETAYRIKPQAIIGIYQMQNHTNNTFQRVCFSADIKSFDEHASLDSDIIATHWLSYDDIKAKASQLRSQLVLKCLDDYRANIRYPLTLIHNTDY